MWTFEKAYAKINLALDCLYRRDDGYHELRMLMQSVDLFDDILIEIDDSGMRLIELQGGAEEIPRDSNNLALKAAELFLYHANMQRKGVQIRLQKRIPAGAGLAGGSSDAAAVLRGMNRMLSYAFSPADLLHIAAEIGSDVPFCLEGGLALAEGRGEKLRKLDCLYDCWIVLAKPAFHVSTQEVFAKFQLKKVLNRPDIDKGIALLQAGDVGLLGSVTANVLESVTLYDHPELLQIKEMMVKNGALWSMMTGSGPTVFGIFDSQGKAYSCFRNLNTKEKFMVRPFFLLDMRSE